MESMARGSEPSAPRPNPSLRTELLLNLAVLAAGALVLAVLSAVLAPLLGHGLFGFALLTVLIAADVAIFLGFGRFLISRLVTAPMEALVEATGPWRRASCRAAPHRGAPASSTASPRASIR